jgi:hypothetical protein
MNGLSGWQARPPSGNSKGLGNRDVAARDQHISRPGLIARPAAQIKASCSYGVGAGTVTQFTMRAGGRTRQYRMMVAEPEPGRVLTESDTGSTAVTSFTVTPRNRTSLVRISTAWEAVGGIGGLFERMFAPRVLRAIYTDELKRLDAYARERRSA